MPERPPIIFPDGERPPIVFPDDAPVAQKKTQSFDPVLQYLGDNPTAEREKIKSSIAHGLFLGVPPGTVYDYHDEFQKEMSNRGLDLQKLKGNSTLGGGAKEKPQEDGQGEKPGSPLKSFAKGFSGGAAGTAEGILSGVEWLLDDVPGLKGIAELAGTGSDILEEGSRILTPPEERGLAYDIGSVGGSMATFMLPGGIVAKGAGKVASVSPFIARWLGASAMSVTEAFTEAGGVFKARRGVAEKQGLKDPKVEAERATQITFWSNLPLLLATNKLGIFADKGSTLRKAITSYLMEGSQEAGQGVISGLSVADPDRPLTAGDIAYQGALGGLGGAGGSLVLSYVDNAVKKARLAKEMPADVKAVYEGVVDGLEARGVESEKAHIEATKTIARMDTGAEYIERVADAVESAMATEAVIEKMVKEVESAPAGEPIEKFDFDAMVEQDKTDDEIRAMIEGQKTQGETEVEAEPTLDAIKAKKQSGQPLTEAEIGFLGKQPLEASQAFKGVKEQQAKMNKEGLTLPPDEVVNNITVEKIAEAKVKGDTATVNEAMTNLKPGVDPQEVAHNVQTLANKMEEAAIMEVVEAPPPASKPKASQKDMFGATKEGLEGPLVSKETAETPLERAMKDAEGRKIEAEEAAKQGKLLTPKTPKPKTYSDLVEFVKSKGGVNYQREHLKGELDIAIENNPRLKWAINKKGKGMTLDEIREAGVESGFLREDANLDDVLDALTGNKKMAASSEDVDYDALYAIWAEKRGGLVLETGGLQTIYESLAKKAGIPESAYEDLLSLGSYAYKNGATTAKAWAESMRTHLGEMWYAFKHLMVKVWQGVKRFNESLGQEGAIKLTPKDKERLGGVGYTQGQIDALTDEMVKAVKIGREAYKAGNKAGVETAKAQFKAATEQRKLLETIKSETKELLDDIRGVKKSLKDTHPEAAELISPIIDSLDFTNMSENRRVELEPLYAFYKEQEGVREIPEELIKPLAALDKKPIKNLTLDELRDIHAAVMEYASLSDKLIKEESYLDDAIKRLSKVKPGVAVAYQKRIVEALQGFDPKKLKDGDAERLTRLREYLDSVKPEDVGMNQETYDMLKKRTARLDKKRLQDMTMDEKRELVDTLRRLDAQGRLMRKLQLAEQGRTRQKIKEKLVADTHTLDVKKDAALRKMAMEAYVKTLTTYRVAEKLDGFQEGGSNARFIVDEVMKEQEAEWTAIEQNQDFIKKAKEIKPEWSEAEQQRIVVVALDIMGANTQRDMLMAELGMEGLPELTAEESRLLELVEETMGANKHDIASVFEYRENKIFPEILRYIFPLKYTAQTRVVNAEILRHDYHKTKETDDYFTQARAKGVKKIIRTDIFNIVREGLQEQNWYINLQPLIDTQASVLFTPEYRAEAGEAGYNFWKDQIDIMARRGYSAKSDTMFRDTSRYLKGARVNLNHAVMGFKVSSAAMQIFSAFDGMVFAMAAQRPSVALRTIPAVVSAWVKKPEMSKTSKALQMRAGGEQALQEIEAEGYKNKFVRWGYAALKEADLRTASGVMRANYDALEGTTEDRVKGAELLMMLSQGGNNIALRPHVLASGEWARTAFTFQTFFLNRWGIVAGDIIDKNLIHGNTKQKAYGASALALMIAASILEDEARDGLYELVSGKESKDTAALKRIISAIPETVPLVGRALSAAIQGRRGDTDVPIVRVVKGGAGGAWDFITKEKWEKKWKGAIKAVEMLLSVGYGVPGTAQVVDLIEAALEDNKNLKPERR